MRGWRRTVSVTNYAKTATGTRWARGGGGCWECGSGGMMRTRNWHCAEMYKEGCIESSETAWRESIKVLGGWTRHGGKLFEIPSSLFRWVWFEIYISSSRWRGWLWVLKGGNHRIQLGFKVFGATSSFQQVVLAKLLSSQSESSISPSKDTGWAFKRSFDFTAPPEV